MVKPANPQAPATSGNNPLPEPIRTQLTPRVEIPAPTQASFIEVSRTSLPNLSGGGQAGTGSVVTDRQRAEAYRNIEGELDRGTQALMAYRQNHNPASLIEARTHLEAAQNAYQAAFPSSEGVIMIRDGSNVISSYDVGGLNTRLNAALLSLRRAEQVESASH